MARSLLLLLAGALGGPLAAQDAAAPDRFPEPFSLIRAVRELSSGRLLVVDWIEERVVALEWARGAIRPIGRVGGGPGEYRLPGALIPMAGDTTLLVDVGNQRLVPITPGLVLGTALRPPVRYPVVPRAADHRGGLWWVVPGWAVGAAPGDSAALVRWDRATGTVSEVARIRGATPRPDAGQPRMTPGFPMVLLAPEDGWAVTPDGDLHLVRSGDYHVERRAAGGGVQAGPAHTWSTPPVTEPERRAFLRRLLAVSPMSGRGPDGGMGHTPPDAQSDQAVAAMARSSTFADRHPFFDPGGVWWVGNGLWVQRIVREDRVVLDRLDAAGRLEGQAVLPPGRRVVGWGREVVYLVATDADGLQWLERYRPVLQR